jgi:hypothetical protein
MASAALAATTTPLAACSTSGTTYEQAVAATWRPFASVVRFGHGPEMPRSLRRSIDAVIVA